MEVLLDACQALRGASAAADAGETPVLLGPGLADLLHFLCAHFNDPRIINPDIRESLLKAIERMMLSPVRPPSPCPLAAGMAGSTAM